MLACPVYKNTLPWHYYEIGRGSLLPYHDIVLKQEEAVYFPDRCPSLAWPCWPCVWSRLGWRMHRSSLTHSSQCLSKVIVSRFCITVCLTVTVSSDIFHFICFWWWVLCIPTLCGRWALLKSSLLLWWFMVVRVVFAVINKIIFVMIMMVMTMKIGNDINKLWFWWWLLLMIMIWIYFDDGHDDDDWKCSKMIVIYFWLRHGSDGDDNELLTTCSNKASQS